MYYRKWDSKKRFITKQELESWKLIKQKEINDSSSFLKLDLKEQVKFDPGTVLEVAQM